ncbi:TPA_asm: hypothetical protein G1Q02_05400 [Salmonella enterica subsp. enterica serovar Typhimurium]|nr:hypothetical protein [Salmonella enterica subsp. enterica serovar Typhimurium]
MKPSVKKIVLAVAACSTFAGAPAAMASAGANPQLPSVNNQSTSGLTMHIVSTITKSTCNIRPYTPAGADATTLNLGVVQPSPASVDVHFFLKPENGCSAGIANSMPKVNDKATLAEITWEGAGLTDHGLANMYGTAKGVHAELKALSGNGAATIVSGSSVAADSVVKTGFQTVSYDTILNGDIPLPFEYAVRIASDDGSAMNPGTFDTDVSYTVAYQ